MTQVEKLVSGDDVPSAESIPTDTPACLTILIGRMMRGEEPYVMRDPNDPIRF